MIIDRFTITAGAALVALLGLAAIASASPVKQFEGTRADVRASCGGQSQHLLEGADYSYCLTSDVFCNDGGLCTTSGLAIAFRRDGAVDGTAND